MSELISHQTEILRSVARSWTTTNCSLIETALHKQFIMRYAQIEGQTVARLTWGRSLSETAGMCNAISSIPLPDGFITQSGSVTIFDPSGEKRMRQDIHVFGAPRDKSVNFIIDIAVGQFYDAQNRGETINIPGDRVRAYATLAPNLLSLLPNGLAVVHGTTEEIFEQMRLKHVY